MAKSKSKASGSRKHSGSPARRVDLNSMTPTPKVEVTPERARGMAGMNYFHVLFGVGVGASVIGFQVTNDFAQMLAALGVLLMLAGAYGSWRTRDRVQQ